MGAPMAWLGGPSLSCSVIPDHKIFLLANVRAIFLFMPMKVIPWALFIMNARTMQQTQLLG